MGRESILGFNFITDPVTGERRPATMHDIPIVKVAGFATGAGVSSYVNAFDALRKVPKSVSGGGIVLGVMDTAAHAVDWRAAINDANAKGEHFYPVVPSDTPVDGVGDKLSLIVQDSSDFYFAKRSARPDDKFLVSATSTTISGALLLTGGSSFIAGGMALGGLATLPPVILAHGIKENGELIEYQLGENIYPNGRDAGINVDPRLYGPVYGPIVQAYYATEAAIKHAWE